MARPEKVAQVDAVTAMFNDAQSVILSDFTGLDVEKISKLRRICRENNVQFRVVKNTLARLGIKGTPAEGLSGFLEGPTAIAISREDEHSAAKVIAKFAEEHEVPKFKGGFVDGSVVEADFVRKLSKLPSKNELVSMLLSGIQGPGNGLVGCLQGPLRNLVSVLGQIKEQKEQS